MEIIPAILPKNFEELETDVGLVTGLVPTVQIDICDGKFVPNITWPYKKHDENFEAILREERGLPHWENIEYEIDLMVKNPEEDVMRWITAGAARIIIHVESTQHLVTTVQKVGSLVDIGLAINIDTPNEVLAPLLGPGIGVDGAEVAGENHIKFIQCMGIAKIGFQGESFDRRVLEKIATLQKMYPNMPISVDGGVTLENARELRDAGATRLVAGSAIFNTTNQADIVSTIHTFKAF